MTKIARKIVQKATCQSEAGERFPVVGGGGGGGSHSRN